MQQIKYTFYGSVPSKKNNRRWIQRGRRKFSVPSLAYESWERAHIPALKTLVGSPELIGFSLEIKPYLPNNRVRDADNILTSILDCLVAAKTIKDDRWQYTGLMLVRQPVIDSINPRVEIVISYEN
jgi:Holliday junction resolvase RusA-like endonuclease